MSDLAALVIATPMAFGVLWCTGFGRWAAERFGVGEDSPKWLRALYVGPWNLT